jgi:hypothetical protein
MKGMKMPKLFSAGKSPVSSTFPPSSTGTTGLLTAGGLLTTLLVLLLRTTFRRFDFLGETWTSAGGSVLLLVTSLLLFDLRIVWISDSLWNLWFHFKKEKFIFIFEKLICCTV